MVCLPVQDPAQLKRAGGMEGDPAVASKQQETAGYAKLQRPSAAVAARVPRPAFHPSGANGWRLGQPTTTVRTTLAQDNRPITMWHASGNRTFLLPDA